MTRNPRKKAILQTAAKLLQNDIKSSVLAQDESYPSVTELQNPTALNYVPPSLIYFLQHLFVGKDCSKKVSSIGHTVIQAVRPRSVIAPLQLGLAIQMHHLYRSKILINTLYAMGFSSSYSEVQSVEKNAVISFSHSMSNFEISKSEHTLLFAGDNVDHNIMTLDGKGSFHGMGIIATITPGKQTSNSISRHKIKDTDLIEASKIDILDYRHAVHTTTNIKFQSLESSPICDRSVDLFWEMSFNFRQISPNWQGMMHILNSEEQRPNKSSVVFLPMIDMNSGDYACIFSTLHYISKFAANHNIPPIITFNQPLFSKA